MKLPISLYVLTTSLLLVAVVIMVGIEVPFKWIFITTIFGQALLVYMVYRVLKDEYATTKTFDNFYEDYPIERK
ncbi:hypothetical protein [Neptunitalea lumnitzerae]|uniref:Uncharacterized protein n=1 Tax=Neptunitalea lumnitzerae TaxID=2965509 RepID=A0ABQ5MHW2_9FLAO|nr:hypothetical protein [Neptunitalea sp. Y10]GLB48984.1 hypothetical protein Y10_13520 [Neptunitalea sp. Y10]